MVQELAFKRFLIWSSSGPPVRWSQTIYAILKEGIVGNIHVKLPFVKFWKKHHEEQFCDIILNLDQWFRRKCCLMVFLIWSFDSPFVQWSITICAILVKGIMKNNPVKLFLIWVSGSGDVI